MREEDEAELRIAVAEGVLSREEAERLRGELRSAGRGPLELLKEHGRLSDETFALLRRAARIARSTNPDETASAAPAPAAPVASPERSPDETATQDPARAGAAPRAVGQAEPAFPVPGWDRYIPVRFLGQGGMGRVFLAYDPRLRREVALKFVRDDDAELARRFVSEARAQARVNHERVCKVYEVGEVQARVFIAMQYVAGSPLGQLAPELSVEQKALLLRDAAEGVHEAHRAGLIHRDIKPSNLMVERTEDGRFKLYVMDFGLARDWREGVTVEGSVFGTPHYMSPEQARGEVASLDRRADVYSLGATLYHLLLGQPPIPGSNGLEVLNRIPTEEPRPPRALDPNVPADLEAIVLKCLEKDRSARYDSARALAEDLERFLAGEPVLARSGGWYRLKKRLRKHRRVVAIASTAMAVALLAVGWGALGRREAALRERLARRFTERVEQVEAQARYSDLSPLHDVRADQRALRARMDELEEEIREGGERALGPGQYALGRGYLALGDEAKARAHLESAWAHGFREPRVAYALGLVMGRLYQEQLLEARCIQNRARRAARVAEVERAYREPALQYLRQSAGAEVPSEDYLAALLAFHEDRHEDALSRLEAAAGKLPWFYEAPQLRGDVLVARAYRRWDAGDGAGARADFDAGRGAYAQAAAIGESVPGIHRARARLELLALQAELYGQGDIMPSFERGQQALANALAASPDHYPSRLLRARFYRRLAEYRRNHGGEVEEPVGKALEAAHAAHALAPEHLDARKELAQIHWIQGAYLEGRSKDPTDPLRQAVALFESIGPGARNYEFHQDLGLVFTTWADYEDQTGADSAAHRSKAIEEFQAAIALDERVPAAWSNVGTAYLSRAALPTAADPEGDLEKAREALGKAQALNPQYVVPYYYAGRASELLADRHHERGQDARPELLRALEQYRKGLGINPKFLALLNGEGSTLLSLAREEWDRGGDPFPSLEQARKSFERMLELEPKQLAALNNAGEAYARRAQFQRKRGEDPAVATRQAADFFRRTMALLPDRSTPWTNLALAQSDLALFELEHGRDPRGSVATAWEAAQAALERNPKDPKAWVAKGACEDVRARLAARQGRGKAEDFEAAASAYEQALALGPLKEEVVTSAIPFFREWGAWLRRSGRGAGPALRRALELADGLLKARPGWPDALALRASVLLEEAEAEPRPERQRELRRQALSALSGAVARNANLGPAWRDQLDRTRLASPSPP